MLTLETAIERVEAISSKHDELRALQSLDRLIESSEIGARATVIEPREPLLIIDQTPSRTTDAHRPPAFLMPAKRTPANVPRSWHWPGTAPLLRGAVVAIFALVLCIVLDRQFGLFGRQAPQPAAPIVQKNESEKPVVHASGAVAQALAAPSRQQSAAFPLPSVYGIYAVSGGQLNELEGLPGRVPDQKVFMSTPIKAPSRTVLPDGRIAFIAYRRDIASSAPERVTVRVIAKVTRAMTYNSGGQANTANVEDSWTIRSTGYELRVAPVSESSEMLMIRHESADFVFPAGRYGLVLKGQAYDFTVAGRITDAAQCLERIEAANGVFYSECKKP